MDPFFCQLPSADKPHPVSFLFQLLYFSLVEFPFDFFFFFIISVCLLRIPLFSFV